MKRIVFPIVLTGMCVHAFIAGAQQPSASASTVCTFTLNCNDFMRPELCGETILRHVQLLAKYGLKANYSFAELVAPAVAKAKPEAIQALKEHGMTVGMHGRLRARETTDRWATSLFDLDPLSLRLMPDRAGCCLEFMKIFDLTPNFGGEGLGAFCRQAWQISPEEQGKMYLAPLICHPDRLRGEALRNKTVTDGDASTNPYLRVYQLRRELAEGVPIRVHTYGQDMSQATLTRARDRLEALVVWINQLDQKGLDVKQIEGLADWIDVTSAARNENDIARVVALDSDYQRLEEKLRSDEGAPEALDALLSRCESLAKTVDSIPDEIRWKFGPPAKFSDPEVRFVAHDTDFFSVEDFGELTYVRGRSPEKLIPARTRPKEEQEAIWSLFEASLKAIVECKGLKAGLPPFARTQRLVENAPLPFLQKTFNVKSYDDMLKVSAPPGLDEILSNERLPRIGGALIRTTR